MSEPAQRATGNPMGAVIRRACPPAGYQRAGHRVLATVRRERRGRVRQPVGRDSPSGTGADRSVATGGEPFGTGVSSPPVPSHCLETGMSDLQVNGRTEKMKKATLLGVTALFAGLGLSAGAIAADAVEKAAATAAPAATTPSAAASPSAATAPSAVAAPSAATTPSATTAPSAKTADAPVDSGDQRRTERDQKRADREKERADRKEAKEAEKEKRKEERETKRAEREDERDAKRNEARPSTP